jgi:hypothetical protein
MAAFLMEDLSIAKRRRLAMPRRACPNATKSRAQEALPLAEQNHLGYCITLTCSRGIHMALRAG